MYEYNIMYQAHFGNFFIFSFHFLLQKQSIIFPFLQVFHMHTQHSSLLQFVVCMYQCTYIGAMMDYYYQNNQEKTQKKTECWWEIIKEKQLKCCCIWAPNVTPSPLFMFNKCEQCNCTLRFKISFITHFRTFFFCLFRVLTKLMEPIIL